jgi:mono/diheme cytochrome c family protein
MRTNLRPALYLALLSGSMVLLGSCTKDPLSPGVEYMPDMYRSPSIETYGVNTNYTDSMSARLPVSGTISQGAIPGQSSLVDAMPYALPNTPEGYEQAGTSLMSPIAKSEATIAEGKVIFEKMCMHCHGAQGGGDGKLIGTGKFPPPPAYNGPLKALPEGKMFHTITYGKGLMGSHASQLSKSERWKVIHYIQELQKL